jgi:hypothetical protein
VVSQEEAMPFGTISCSSNFGNSAELDKKYFHLAAATPGEIVGLQKSKPALSAGRLAGGKFPYDKVDAHTRAAARHAPNRSRHRSTARRERSTQRWMSSLPTNTIWTVSGLTPAIRGSTPRRAL